METVQFLELHNIKTSDLEKNNIDIEALEKIKQDHISNYSTLTEFAKSHANILQSCEHVHSVRWRVKDPNHLVKKIIRKQLELDKNPKYGNLSVKNYKSIVTDLIGVRALHLFKDSWSEINKFIEQKWNHKEKIAYVREGDPNDLIESYRKNGCTVENHPRSYRSVHFVTSHKPAKDEIFIETQVRTLFEEGWSEIDHKIRYPDEINDPLINIFLNLFNRLSGNADEMGSFVGLLNASLKNHTKEKTAQKEAIQKQLLRIENLAGELQSEKNQSEARKNKITDLSNTIKSLKENSIQIPTYDVSGILEEYNKNVGNLNSLFSKQQTMAHMLGLAAAENPKKLDDKN